MSYGRPRSRSTARGLFLLSLFVGAGGDDGAPSASLATFSLNHSNLSLDSLYDSTLGSARVSSPDVADLNAAKGQQALAAGRDPVRVTASRQQTSDAVSGIPTSAAAIRMRGLIPSEVSGFGPRRRLLASIYIGQFTVLGGTQYVDGEAQTIESLTCQEACAIVFASRGMTAWEGSLSSSAITNTCYGDQFGTDCNNIGAQADTYKAGPLYNYNGACDHVGRHDRVGSTGTHVPVTGIWGDARGSYSVGFDGREDYIVTPVLEDVQAVSLWILLPPTQPGPSFLIHYLVDFNPRFIIGDQSEMPYIHTGGFSAHWSAAYVNGREMSPMTWGQLPGEEWVHFAGNLHVSVTSEITLMASTTPYWNANAEQLVPNRFMQGRLSDLAFWGAPLELWKVEVLAEGIYYRRRRQLLFDIRSTNFWDALIAYYIRVAPPAPGYPHWCVLFDGVDDYLSLPEIEGIYSISTWIKVDSKEQTRVEYALLDGRSSNDVFLTNRAMGETWEDLYVNGDREIDANTWNHGEWKHVTVEANAGFTEAFTIMGSMGTNQASQRCTKGCLAAVFVWDRLLTTTELYTLALYGAKEACIFFLAHCDEESGSAPEARGGTIAEAFHPGAG
eukprot:gene11429-13506_t